MTKNAISALIGYPLSSEYRRKLGVSVGQEPTYMSVAELRRLPVKQLLRSLWKDVGETLLIPLEDANSMALLPVLETLASVSGARSIEVVYPDFTRQKVRRVRAMDRFLRMVNASIASKRSASRCRRELSGLLREPRIDVSPAWDKKSVLYLKTNLWFGVKAGGSVGHIAGVVNGLIEKDYEVLFAAAEEPVMLNAKAQFMPIDPPRIFGLPSELNYYRFQEMFHPQVIAKVGNFRPSFVYQRLSVANYSGVNLSRHFEVPLILEYNGSEAWIAKHWGNALRYHELAVMAEDAALRHAHIVVTISDVLRDELLERGVDESRIVVYPNCVDERFFNPGNFRQNEKLALRNEYGIDADSTLVTFVGTFGQWHGAEILARAIRELVEEDSEWLERNNVHFMFVGDGLRMPDVRTELAASEAKRFVTLTGLVEQRKAPLHLAASDILVSPHVANADGSRFFGSPTKLFEYMAMAKGIVASDLEQIGEILVPAVRLNESSNANGVNADREVAVLVKPGDVGELKQGIRLLIQNQGLAETLGNHARAAVLSNYTWRHHVEAIIKGIRAVAE